MTSTERKIVNPNTSKLPYTSIFLLGVCFCLATHIWYGYFDLTLKAVFVYVPFWLSGILSALFLRSIKSIKCYLLESPLFIAMALGSVILELIFCDTSFLFAGIQNPSSLFTLRNAYTSHALEKNFLVCPTPILGELYYYFFGVNVSLGIASLIRIIIRRNFSVLFRPRWQLLFGLFFPWGVGYLNRIYVWLLGIQRLFQSQLTSVSAEKLQFFLRNLSSSISLLYLLAVIALLFYPLLVPVQIPSRVLIGSLIILSCFEWLWTAETFALSIPMSAQSASSGYPLVTPPLYSLIYHHEARSSRPQYYIYLGVLVSIAFQSVPSNKLS